MPIYEYECKSCGAIVEFIQKFSEAPKRKCPECERLKLKRRVTAAAFHLKGSGWYVTDFRDKKVAKGKDAEKSGEATASSSDADSSSKTESSSKGDSAEKGDSAGKKNAESSSDASSTKKSKPVPKKPSGSNANA